MPELSATLRLPGCTLGGAPLQLRFQFPQAYPALPLKLHVLTAAPRWATQAELCLCNPSRVEWGRHAHVEITSLGGLAEHMCS